jgi:hypothetical protein
MQRQLIRFSLCTLILSTATLAFAGNNFEDWIRRLSKPSKYLVLTSTREESPVYKMSPKLVSFKGVIKVPSYMMLESGSPRVHGSAGQLVIDGQITCNYSPRSHSDRYYVLRECSDGSRSGEKVDVQNKIEVKLNFASSVKASLTSKISVVQSSAVEYGINFPYIKAEEGQILIYNGEAWVAGDVSELNISGIKGDKGDPGIAGPQGPAGVAGSDGLQGAKGDAGANGLAGVQGPAGANGVAGPQGPAGANGVAGPQGPAGANGVAGPQGPAGVAGPQGATGPKGDNGVAGLAGAQGPVGPAGSQGERGLQGIKGNDGAAGFAGAQGPAGATGAVGPKGDNGIDGLAGVQGPAGPAGAVGSQGPKGDKGDSSLTEIAYLRDERASGQHGGSCIGGGVWNPRSLNVLGGDIGFISLANNRFLLQPGKYFVEITAPASATAAHQAKLKVIETGVDVLIGSSSFSHPTSQSASQSIISGELIIAAASTFEIQHRCGSEKLFTGLGQATAFGTVEIYTQVKIIKKQ